MSSITLALPSIVTPSGDATRLPAAIDVEFFRRMADLANEGFYLLNREGRFLYVNAKAIAQMGGYSVDDLLGMTVSDMCPDVPPDQFAENVAPLEQGASPPYEVWTRRKDAGMFLCEVRTARLELDGEVYYFGVARDVTARKAAEAVRKSLAAKLLDTLENERQRVARELHDDVGQLLATIGVMLDTFDMTPNAVPDAAKPTLLATRRTIGRITDSLARIVREYHPADLLGLGLEDTLRVHTRQFAERHALALRLSTEPVEGLLTPEQELHVYRVVQEALVNAVRHGHAAHVDVDVSQTDDAVVVQIRDDGLGFDGAHPPGPGIGLSTMRERAMLMHGALAVRSAPGAGTTIELSVPLAPPMPAADAPAIDAAASTIAATTAVRPPPGTVGSPLPPALDLEVFRRMADMSTDAFNVVDRHGRFIYVNDRSCTLWGFSRDELLEMGVPDLNPDFPRDVWQEWVEHVPDAVPPFETRNVRKDGSVVPVEVSVARITANGEPYFFALVFDITERRETEAAQQGFTRRLLYTLEAERRRVARELHDEVGQAIATVGVLLHTLESTPGSVPAVLHAGLADTHATIRQIIESVAHVVRDYDPADLLGLGLEDTIRTHAQHFAQRHGLALRLAACSVEGLLSDQHALHVFRIVQEALANVARHARARHVSVGLARRRSQVVVTVRDDGVGFDATQTRGGGFGLVTMRERAALIGAALDVRSKRGRGTEVRLAIAATASRGATGGRA